MTNTPHGVLVVGRDPSGEVRVAEVLEDIEAPQRFVGIQRAPDETLFVAGTNVRQGGVDPAAFVAPWPD